LEFLLQRTEKVKITKCQVWGIGWIQQHLDANCGKIFLGFFSTIELNKELNLSPEKSPDENSWLGQCSAQNERSQLMNPRLLLRYFFGQVIFEPPLITPERNRFTLNLITRHCDNWDICVYDCWTKNQIEHMNQKRMKHPWFGHWTLIWAADPQDQDLTIENNAEICGETWNKPTRQAWSVKSERRQDLECFVLSPCPKASYDWTNSSFLIGSGWQTRKRSLISCPSQSGNHSSRALAMAF
jgi:hypothetical protein